MLMRRRRSIEELPRLGGPLDDTEIMRILQALSRVHELAPRMARTGQPFESTCRPPELSFAPEHPPRAAENPASVTISWFFAHRHLR